MNYIPLNTRTTQLKYPEVEFLLGDFSHSFALPLYGSRVPAGFPSPADDYIELSLNISDYVASNPTSTFFIRVTGYSMIEAFIPHNAVLTVDKSLKAKHNDIVLAFLNGEYTVKRLLIQGNKYVLKPENRNYRPIEITPDDELIIWGVVTSVVFKFKEIE